MPTSSGFDRTNYGTTLNFSRYGANGTPNMNHHQHYNPSNQQPTTRKSNPNVSLSSSNDNYHNYQNPSQPKFFTSVRNGHSYKQHYVAAKNLKASSTASSPNVGQMETNRVDDPFSVNIKDPNLREIVQKLVKINDLAGD